MKKKIESKAAPKKTAPKSAPKSAPKAKEEAAPKVAPSEEITGKKRARIPADFLIVSLIEKNPTNPTKARFGNYEIWFSAKAPISVEEYRAKGGVMFDLLDAVKLGRAKIVPFEVAEKIAPKAKAAPKKKTVAKA